MKDFAKIIVLLAGASSLAACSSDGASTSQLASVSTEGLKASVTALPPAPPSADATPTPSPAPAIADTSILVANAAELNVALNKAVAGDVIKLKAGQYGDLRLVNRTFPANVSIIGAQGVTASFDTVTLNNVKNLSFSNVSVGRPLKVGEPTWVRFATVISSSAIAFDNVKFHGSMDGNCQNDGRGIRVSTSTDVAVTNSTFEQLELGMEIGSTSRVKLSGNNIHDIRTDGIAMAGVSDVLIERNQFSRFFGIMGANGAGDHPDAIQFFTAGANKASQNIVIRSNVIMAGDDSSVMQGIFLADQVGGLPYRNVSIENNLVYVRAWNGIMVGNGDGVTIAKNTVVSPTRGAMQSRIRLDNTIKATVQNNVVDEFTFLNSSPTVSGNVEVRYNQSARAILVGLDLGVFAKVAQLLFPNAGFSLNG